MTFEKTHYIIVNLAAIGTITGLFAGAFYYEKDQKKADVCLTISAVSAIITLTYPFVSNIADAFIEELI